MNIQSIQEWTEQMVHLIEHAPAWLSFTILFFSAWIEYVFPPFPGDTLLVAGGFFAARGAISLFLVLPALVLGSGSGCVIGWWIGRTALKHEWSKRFVHWFVSPTFLEKLEKSYERYGVAILLANRFLPGIRGAFMIAAGIANLPLRSVFIWGSVSALIWNSLLIGVGYLFSAKLETMLNWVENYTIAVFILLGLIMAGVFFRWLFKKIKTRP